MPDKLSIAGVDILPGESRKIQLKAARLYTDTEIFIPVYIKRGKKPGPTLFVCAAIHGDELNGIEVISRLLKKRALEGIRGNLIAVPMVNVYGVLNQSRYLPDRRDLNRAFPGSRKGSLAGRTADLFMREVVSKSHYGIDLHTGALHRSNLPQVRGNLKNPQTLALARAFGVPMLLNSDLRDGSLREAAEERGIPVVLYEGGQALRYDEPCIRAGVQGILNVMVHIGMLSARHCRPPRREPFIAQESSWVRATDSGFALHRRHLGDVVERGSLLATIHNPYGDKLADILAPEEGIIIGRQNIPLVQEGEAMFNLALFRPRKPGEAPATAPEAPLEESLDGKSKPAP